MTTLLPETMTRQILQTRLPALTAAAAAKNAETTVAATRAEITTAVASLVSPAILRPMSAHAHRLATANSALTMTAAAELAAANPMRHAMKEPVHAYVFPIVKMTGLAVMTVAADLAEKAAEKKEHASHQLINAKLALS